MKEVYPPAFPLYNVKKSDVIKFVVQDIYTVYEDKLSFDETYVDIYLNQKRIHTRILIPSTTPLTIFNPVNADNLFERSYKVIQLNDYSEVIRENTYRMTYHRATGITIELEYNLPSLGGILLELLETNIQDIEW